jgi:hypothetical protein
LDELSNALGRPVALEDRAFQLLDYSVHRDFGDPVRLTSILSRQAPPEVRRWLDELHLDRSEGIVHVAANADLGMEARECCPVRHAGILLGYLWVLRGDMPLTDEEARALAATAEQAGMLLWRERLLEHEERIGETRMLTRLLRDGEARSRQAAAAALARQDGWRPDSPVAVLVARFAPGDPRPGDELAVALAVIGDRARRCWDAGSVAWMVEPGQLAVVAQLGGLKRQSVEDTVETLEAAGAEVVGASVSPGLVDAHLALDEAELVCDIIAAVPSLGPTAVWGELGSWGLLGSLLLRGTCPPSHSGVARLLNHPSAGDLFETIEAFLDAAGDATEVARTLHMHRATLYRRLRRAEEITGLSLSRGEDRLLLHVALRIWRFDGASTATTVATRR